MADSDARPSSASRHTRPVPTRRSETASRAASSPNATTRAASQAPATAPAPDREAVRPHTEGGATAEPAIPPPPGPISEVGPAEAPSSVRTGSTRPDVVPEAPPPPEGPQPEAEATAETGPGTEGEAAGEEAAIPEGTVPEGEGLVGEAEGETKGGKKGGGGLAADVAATVTAALRQSSQPAVDRQGQQLEAVAASRRETPDPAALVEQAEQAQTPPEGEAESRAQAASVEAVEAADAPAPDAGEARRSLSHGIADHMPTTLEEVDDFAEAGDMTESVRGLVRSQTAGVAQTYGAIERTPPPAPPAAPTVPLPELPLPPPVDRPALGADAVGTFPPEAADLSAMTDASDSALAESGLTDEHLALVTDGPLAEARAEREGVAQTVADAPARIDETRAAEQARVQEELTAEEEAGETEMQAEREAGLTDARTDQEATTVEMEAKRAEVTAHIQGIYDRANEQVTTKLDALEETSLQRFEEGQQAATATFERNVGRRMDAFKERRYGGWLGWSRWIEDQIWDITELPPVQRIITEEKDAFLATIDGLLASITADITATIAECQQIVADARIEIQEYVDGLGPDLRDVGTQKATALQARFAELDQAINQRRDALQADLAERREAAIAEVEQMIEDMRTGVAAALERLGELLADAAAEFVRWALRQAGLDPEPFFAAIRRAREAIGTIASDPLAFLGNLITAVRGGIEQFRTNIRQHLVGGLIDWLTGAMSTVPIQLPETWDLKGILHLVLQILGLTWDRIRAKLVERVGERPVAIAETTVDVIQRLVRDGPIALWDMLVEKAEEIKQQAMEAVKGWAILQLVKAGVIKLVSMLNPAGAIVQGVITIFNVIMFFVENMQRIIDFARSVIDSVSNIAAGRTGAAASYIERTMARTIPILLGFLGRLIPVSGIGRAVQNAIERVRAPIDRIVNRAIDRMVGLVRRVAGGARRGAQRVAQGARDAAGRLLQWWRKEERFRDEGGGAHRVYLQRRGAQVDLMMASTPAVLRTQLEPLRQRATPEDRPGVDAALMLVGRVEDQIDRLERAGAREARTAAQDAEVDRLNRQLDALLGQLVAQLRRISFVGAEDFDLPRPRYRYERDAGRASVAAVELLSPNRSLGTPTGTSSPPGWPHLQVESVTSGQRLTTSGQRWVQMHLVNRRFGGHGRAENLVAGTTGNNLGDYPRFDNWVDQRIGPEPGSQAEAHRNVVWIEATAVYRTGVSAVSRGHWGQIRGANPALSGTIAEPPNPAHYAYRLTLTAGEHTRRGQTWAKGRAAHTVRFTVPEPDWRSVLGRPVPYAGITRSRLLAAVRSATRYSPGGAGASTPLDTILDRTVWDHLRAVGPTTRATVATDVNAYIAAHPTAHASTQSRLRAVATILLNVSDPGAPDDYRLRL